MKKTNRPSLHPKSGQTLVVAILLLAVALITIPALVWVVQNEGKWTVKESHSNVAYHLAEAGQDRAAWYMSLSTAAWAGLLQGIPVTGYAGDVQYSDVAGGLYTISLSSGPSTNEVTAITKGQDTRSKEVRVIQTIYSGAPLLSGLVTWGNFATNANFYVYWGQITSYTTITATTGQTAFSGCDATGNPTGGSTPGDPPYYPIKDAAGSITPWKTTPTPPTTDNTKGYIAFDQNLGNSPTIDFNYYRTLAQNSKIPVPSNTGGQTAPWAGTGYFDGTNGGNSSQGNTTMVWDNYYLNCSTCVIFIENESLNFGDWAQTTNGYVLVQALIIKQGNLHIHSDGLYGAVLNVPSNAWQQFEAGTYTTPNSGDTAATGEYPGDCGYHTSCATYTVPNSSHTPYCSFGGCVTPSRFPSPYAAYASPPYDQCASTGLAFKGFLYAYSFDCSSGRNALAGAISIGPGGTDIASGGFGTSVSHIIYFDPAVAGNVRYVNPPLSRVSWQEQTGTWP